MIVLTAATLLLFGGVIALIPLGLRAGDRPGDAFLMDVAPRSAPRGAVLTIANPGEEALIVGVSLRRAGPRLRLEGGAYVRIRTGSTAAELLVNGQARIGALAAGETQTFVVPAGAAVPRRAELVAVIGQHERLRTIHRLVMLPDLAVTRVRLVPGAFRTRREPPKRAQDRTAPRPRDASTRRR